MTRYEVVTVDGGKFIWDGELGSNTQGAFAVDLPAGWLVCPGGTIINPAFIVTIYPM